MTVRKLFSIAVLTAVSAAATPFFFSTGNPDGAMGMASRPRGGGLIEIEAADDFTLATSTLLTSATFTGLIAGGSTSDINQVRVEIYRVFPLDSDVGRTSGPPTFSTSQVPTRVNSPSDDAFATRDSAAGSELAFSSAEVAASFTTGNSVLNGIHPTPDQSTGGEGAVIGIEVQFNVSFTSPLLLTAGHYFLVPQVGLGHGDFYWLSAPRPIVAPGNPFNPDLQAWIRNENLAPDWLRVGTDIVGGTPAPTFNATFTLSGAAVPEPSTAALVAFGAAAVLLRRRFR